MKHPRNTSPPFQPFSDSTSNRLHAYALAGTAAGVSLLALTQPALAEIVYTPTNVVIGVGGTKSYALDLNGDGVTDLFLDTAHHCNTDQCFYDLWTRIVPGNGVVATHTSFGFTPASALNRGAAIPGNGKIFGGTAFMASFYQGGGGYSAHGPWANVQSRYLGIAFKINGETHYGWARLSVKDDRLKISATLLGYAYETEANQPIRAGQTSGSYLPGISQGNQAGENPTPVSLGLLARGSLGLEVWRRE
jgi:hypothetical protein